MLSLVSPHMQISVLPLLRNPRARSDFMFELIRCYSSLLLFVSVHFLYVPCNLFATLMSFNSRKKLNVSMHGLYYYKQNNDHTNLWMKIILSCGMMTILFLV